MTRFLEQLRSTGFRDLSGSQTATTLTIGETLLNAAVAAALSPRAPLRELSVHPQADDRLAIRAKLVRPEFLPPISAIIAIERQPELPGNPTLGLRITGLAGLFALAGPLLSLAPKLPRGLRLDGDLLTVDLRELLVDRGQEDLLGLVQRIAVHSEEGRIRIELDARVT